MVVSASEPDGDAAPRSAVAERLTEAAQELSLARDLPTIMSVVRQAARALTGADGATFILSDGELCYYADEDAIAPLWKGARFPKHACISGWSMLNRSAVVIEDIYQDARVPHDAYRPTFVKSLAMVPIREREPVGAIGNYWARSHRASAEELRGLQTLANLTSVAMANVQLYDELQQRVRECQAAVEARDEFIAIAAHELRTPLTALQLQLQGLLLRKESVEPGLLSERVSRAIQSGKRLGLLIDGLLDVSQAAQGNLVLETQQLDLVELCRNVVSGFDRAAERAGCALSFDARQAVTGIWDGTRIEQVLAHLLSNALKFGRGMPIEVRVLRRGAEVRLEVQDHGTGIPPELADKLFERFGRAGAVNHYAGLGLGLYLAREIVEAHGGRIRCHSAPNEGSTFIVELPLEAAAAS